MWADSSVPAFPGFAAAVAVGVSTLAFAEVLADRPLLAWGLRCGGFLVVALAYAALVARHGRRIVP